MRLGKAIATGYAEEAVEQAAVETVEADTESMPATVTAEAEADSEQVVVGTAG